MCLSIKNFILEVEKLFAHRFQLGTRFEPLRLTPLHGGQRYKPTKLQVQSDGFHLTIDVQWFLEAWSIFYP
jgi:hypothetical protein